ncbi:hypothetical protein [Anaerovibrio lipolyticus]|uniref:hypothetical protein n=1 Tax=Anaerovibrio lipolyticus TaxID=82374 RepID=UPI0013566E0A|nr:hypothetical protein [Anaerovibrio lipolyticus]
MGTIDDYDALANVVRCNAPDDLMEIYGVAEDIWAHSGCAESVEDIMSLLCKEAITSCFKVEEG